MSEPTPVLHVHVTARGVDERMCVPLDRTLGLGRDAECDVALPSATVSRRHLSLFMRDGRLMVRDHSSNGTRVNGEALHLAVRELSGRGTLEVGPYAIEVRLDDASSEPSVPATIAPAVVVPVAAPLMLSDRAADERWNASLAGAAPRWNLSRSPLPPVSIEAYERMRVLTPVVAKPAPAEADWIAQPSQQGQEDSDQLEQLLGDPSVSAIMLIDAATLFVERAGRRERCPSRFRDDDAVRAALERLLAPLGIDTHRDSCFSAELDDGTRVHAILPPLSRRGPCITLRKPPSERRTLAELRERGGLSHDHARRLERAVRERRSIVICGESGSGATSLLDGLAEAIPDHERVVTIETHAELTLEQPHVISLLADAGARSCELLAQCAPLRADRVLLGECTEGEAYAWLRTITRLSGCITVLRAESPRSALARFEAWCQFAAPELPLSALRQRIAATRALFVQLARAEDGTRSVVSMLELGDIGSEGELTLCEPSAREEVV